VGALLLVSDNPMTPDGVKTVESDRKVTSNFVDLHVKLGIEALTMIKEDNITVRHLRMEF
jgi:AMP nucleosidase